MSATQQCWTKKPLGEIANVISGYAFKSSDFGDSGVPIIKIKNIRVGTVDLSEVDRVAESFLKLPERYHVKAGDILISLTGSHISQPNSVVGRVARYSVGMPQCLLNQRAGKVIVKDSNSCDMRFLFYALSETETVRAIALKAQGAASQANVSPSQVESIEITLPALPTQRRIASILSAYDELIENNQRRISILEDMARSLYREWFVHFRYPGYESIPLVASSLGQIPQGWEVKKLSDIAIVNRTQINAKTAPKELNYIDIASVSPGQIDYVTTYAFSDAPGRARRVVQHGDVLWSCVRPNRRSHALIMHPEANTIASTGFAVLTAKAVPFTFLYYATTTDDFVSYLTNNASGAAYPAVTSTTFEKAELLIPSSASLERFGEATIAMTEQAYTLQRQTANLRRTRDLLLPRLLSGQIKIDTNETIIEEAVA